MKRILCWIIGHADAWVYDLWVQGRRQRAWAECRRCGKRVWVGE